MTPFPNLVSFTITEACSLRCGICGQWGEAGYVPRARRGPGLPLAGWQRLVAEVAREGPAHILVRGGEPFLHPGLIPLLETIGRAGVPVSVDTAGTELEEHARAVARIGDLHLTISMDGPPEVHDRARGVPGTFERVERGLRALHREVEAAGTRVSLSLCCTIGPDSYRTLAELPGVARRLGVRVVSVVPCCYLSPAVLRAHRAALVDLDSGCPAAPGFERAAPRVDPVVVVEQLRLLRQRLDGVEEYPYMPLRPDEYLAWFSDPAAAVGVDRCRSVERVIDIQPDGDANFCVDLADYRIGNVRGRSIAELWRSEQAERFRARVRERRLPGCVRCVARYMGEQG